MEININSDTKLSDIKQAFSSVWPHLKLVFFSKPHEEHHGTSAKFMIDDDSSTVGQVVPGFSKSDSLSISGNTTVWHVEQLFENNFGLHAHVFRRSGNTWLESTVSDDLTLEQQEATGAAGDHQRLFNTELPDYREQD